MAELTDGGSESSCLRPRFFGPGLPSSFCGARAFPPAAISTRRVRRPGLMGATDRSRTAARRGRQRCAVAYTSP